MIFPSGNALKYLREYFDEDAAPVSPYEEDPEDIRLVWKKLKDDERFNIEVCAINLRLCAAEMTGRTDFSSFSDEETKLALTRYNANVRHVTAYGEDAFRLMQMFSEPASRE